MSDTPFVVSALNDIFGAGTGKSHTIHPRSSTSEVLEFFQKRVPAMTSRDLSVGTHEWILQASLSKSNEINNQSIIYNDISYTRRSNTSNCAFLREFGRDRFIFARLTTLPGFDGNDLKENCVSLGQRKFYFLGGKQFKQKHAKRFGKAEKGKENKCFVAWYFRSTVSDSNEGEEYHRILSSDLGRRGKVDVTIAQLRGWLADFQGVSPIKLNSRLSLGFSSSISSSFELECHQVILCDNDIQSETGNIMTDGCGLISVRH